MADPKLPARYTAFHNAGGALLNSALGAAWALLGILALRPVGMPWAAIAAGVATGVLLVLSFRAVQRAGTVDDEDMLPEVAAERTRRATLSHRVLRIEGLAITAVSAALVVTENHAYIAPATTLIVGLHYLALAPIHRTRVDGIAGALIVALSVATILWVPDIPSVHQNAMNIAAGFGTAVVLWGTAITMLSSTSTPD